MKEVNRPKETGRKGAEEPTKEIKRDGKPVRKRHEPVDRRRGGIRPVRLRSREIPAPEADPTIKISSYLTPVEQRIQGGTFLPGVDFLPPGLKEGYSIEQINEARRKRGPLKDPITTMGFRSKVKLQPGQSLYIELPELDAETGEPHKNPRILAGKWDGTYVDGTGELSGDLIDVTEEFVGFYDEQMEGQDGFSLRRAMEREERS